MIQNDLSYYTPKQILENINLISSFGAIEFTVLFSSILIFSLLIFYILPSLGVFVKYIKKEKEKRKKKILLKKIILQKEIEDSIMKEVEIEDKKLKEATNWQ